MYNLHIYGSVTYNQAAGLIHATVQPPTAVSVASVGAPAMRVSVTWLPPGYLHSAMPASVVSAAVTARAPSFMVEAELQKPPVLSGRADAAVLSLPFVVSLISGLPFISADGDARASSIITAIGFSVPAVRYSSSVVSVAAALLSSVPAPAVMAPCNIGAAVAFLLSFVSSPAASGCGATKTLPITTLGLMTTPKRINTLTALFYELALNELFSWVLTSTDELAYALPLDGEVVITLVQRN